MPIQVSTVRAEMARHQIKQKDVAKAIKRDVSEISRLLRESDIRPNLLATVWAYVQKRIAAAKA